MFYLACIMVIVIQYLVLEDSLSSDLNTVDTSPLRMSSLPETQRERERGERYSLERGSASPFLPATDIHDEPLHAVLTAGPGEAAGDGVEGGVAGHHRASHPLKAGQDPGLLSLPGELDVDEDAVHEDVRVRGHHLLQELQVLYLDLSLQ